MDKLIPDEQVRFLVLSTMADEAKTKGYEFTAETLTKMARGAKVENHTLPYDTQEKLTFGLALARWIEDYIREETFGKARDRVLERLEKIADKMEKANAD